MIKKIIVISVFALIIPIVVCASDAASGEQASGSSGGMLGFAAALAICVAAFGGALGQGKAIASALEAIGRNPAASSKIQTPMIIGLALIESLVIYSFVISFLLISKF